MLPFPSPRSTLPTRLHPPPSTSPCSDERQHALQQEAWNVANDSLRTTLCVRYRAEAVACGILFTAARKLQVGRVRVKASRLQGFRASCRDEEDRTLQHRRRSCAACPPACLAPSHVSLTSSPHFPLLPAPQISLPEDPPWWALFEVKEAELVDVCRTLCDLYRQPRARHLPVGRPASAPAVGAPGARSPLSAQPTPPLRSPATAARANGGASAAAAEAAPATAAPRSDGEAPSVAQQDGETEGEKDKVKSKEKEGDSRWRRRSRSRSRSHGRSHRSQRRDSRSRSPRDRQKRSRSSGRSASASRSASRSPPACSPGRDRRPSPPRDRRPSPRRDRRPSPRRDRSRHDDLPIYRPGGRSDRRSNRGDRRRDGELLSFVVSHMSARCTHSWPLCWAPWRWRKAGTVVVCKASDAKGLAAAAGTEASKVTHLTLRLHFPT